MVDALAAPAMFFWLSMFRPKEVVQTPAQKAMIAMLHEMAGNQWNGVVQYNDKRYQARELIEICMDVAPGGFLLIAGDYTFLKPYFIEHGWQVMPFTFGEHFIFRKPMLSAA